MSLRRRQKAATEVDGLLPGQRQNGWDVFGGR
jgi:hypothetical protein